MHNEPSKAMPLEPTAVITPIAFAHKFKHLYSNTIAPPCYDLKAIVSTNPYHPILAIILL